MNQKGFINIILLVVIVALVGTGVYFVATRQVTPPTPNSTLSPTPTPKTYDWTVEFILCKECSPYKLDVFTEQELLLLKDELLIQLPDGEVSFEKLRSPVLNGFFINMTDFAYKNFIDNMKKDRIHLSGAKISTTYYKVISGQQKVPTNEDEIYVCNEDRSCISVNAGQCGCNAGGNATTINKQYLDYWKEKTSKPGVMCLAVISDDPTCFMKPKCIQNKCILQK